jgi:hypothetical protein
MEKKASLNENLKEAVSSKIQKGKEKIEKQLTDKLKTNTELPIKKNISKIAYLRNGFKALGAGFLVLTLIKPSIIENIFNSFDFSQRKKDRTETRGIKFPKEVSKKFTKIIYLLKNLD